MRILLVDDNPFAIKTLQEKLEGAGHRVETATDGIKALNAIRTSPPDLVLLDIMLPRLDGYRVCKLLKQDDRFQAIPVVMLTSKAGEEDKELGLELGVDNFVLKSADFKDLLPEIEKDYTRTQKYQI